MATRRRGNSALAAVLEARDQRDYAPPPAPSRPHLLPDDAPGVASWVGTHDPDDGPRFVDERLEAARQREAELLIRVGDLEEQYTRRLREYAQSGPPVAPTAPAPFTPTIWRCEVYPEYTLHLATLGVVVQFRAGSYTATSPAVDAVLAQLKGKKPIRRFSGVNIFRCGLCDFVSVDEEEVSDHRAAAHDLTGLRATVED